MSRERERYAVSRGGKYAVKQPQVPMFTVDLPDRLTSTSVGPDGDHRYARLIVTTSNEVNQWGRLIPARTLSGPGALAQIATI